MTHIKYHQREAWRPGNDAIHVTTSSSPAEALSHTSALGMALYGAVETLGISAYPAQAGVVFEGNLPTIDNNREKLLRIAPEIAQKALRECEYGRESAGGLNYLTQDVASFGAPMPKHDSFGNRLKRSISPFAQSCTWDGCFEYVSGSEYQPPLDHRIQEILYDIRWSKETQANAAKKVVAIPVEVLKVLESLGHLDNVSQQQEIAAALQYYTIVRTQDDPDLDLRIRAFDVHNKHAIIKAKKRAKSIIPQAAESSRSQQLLNSPLLTDM